MADSQRKTANLFDLASWIIANGATYTKDGESYTFDTKQSMFSTPFYFSNTDIDVSISGIIESITAPNPRLHLLKANGASAKSGALTPSTLKSENISCAGLKLDWSGTGGTVKISNLMLNTGSTALPYEPCGWVHSLRKLTTATDTITTLPADLYADGNNATVGLVGNMQQTGTPTPNSPIQPQECGERTGNLLGETLTPGYHLDITTGLPVTFGNYSRCATLTPIDVSGINTVTLSLKNLSADSKYFMYSLFNGTTLIERVAGKSPGDSIDVSSATDIYISVYSEIASADVTTRISDIMLNLGSTAIPYEPYGVKIPISSANTTTPVYLGEVETTRKIKKLVLTGEENFQLHSSIANLFTLTTVTDYLFEEKVITMCTHYRGGVNTGATSALDGTVRFYYGSAAQTRIFYVKDTNFSTAADFKTYLQQQYANGTPVCVWYVLAEPTTGIVNEPLRKIGDYADTVSGITIPTITGKDTFDVLTTLKPSEVSLSYTGWHDASVKEWDGSEWQ